jgi:hypothetical protein
MTSGKAQMPEVLRGSLTRFIDCVLLSEFQFKNGTFMANLDIYTQFYGVYNRVVAKIPLCSLRYIGARATPAVALVRFADFAHQRVCRNSS